MYHPTETTNALTKTTWFHSLYSHTPERLNKYNYPSRLEIVLLVDSGASFFVLKYPTYIAIAKLLNITCNNETTDSSKTLTVASQT